MMQDSSHRLRWNCFLSFFSIVNYTWWFYLERNSYRATFYFIT